MSLMKKLVAIGALAGAIGLVGVSMANAGGPDGEGRRGAFIAKFDTNGDGKLDDAERKAMHEAMQARRAEMIARFDTNKDGKLDDAERKVMHDTLAGERFKKLDTNGDGVLSPDEFKAGVGHRHARHDHTR